jgi:hypothetical protein
MRRGISRKSVRALVNTFHNARSSGVSDDR